MTGCRTSEGRPGGRGAKRNRGYPLHDYITNDVIIMFAIVIERKINALRYIVQSANKLFNVRQLLAIHVFHIRPATRISVNLDGSSSASIHAICVLPYQPAARQQESTRGTPSSRRSTSIHWSKLRIVLFFDTAGWKQKRLLLRCRQTNVTNGR